MKKNKFVFFWMIGGIIALVVNFIFYIKFFQNMDYEIFIYIPISVFLIFLNSGLYFLGIKIKKFSLMFVAVIVSLFSIFCNVSVQYSDARQKSDRQEFETIKKSDDSDDKKYYRERIAELNKEYNSYNSAKFETIKNLNDRFEYKQTSALVEERQKEITENIKYYESMLNEKTEIESKIIPDIFDFITNSMDQKLLVTFIFIIFLSIVLELSTPMFFYLYLLESKEIVVSVGNPDYPRPTTTLVEEKNPDRNNIAVAGFTMTKTRMRKKVLDDDLYQPDLFKEE